MHPDLAKLAAFDTFIGNADRSLPNIFYNKKENVFYGIDHAAAFNNKKLAKFAYDRIKELQKKKFFETCDKKIVCGLTIYLRYLQDLYNQINPANITVFLCKNCKYLDLKKENNYISYINSHSDAFSRNYEWVNRLIILIKDIVKSR